MPNVIQAIRPEVNRTFPIPGFRIRTDFSPAWGEVAVATSPNLLFDPAVRKQRTPNNFYSSRGEQLFPIKRGEAIYLLPPAVMNRFAGQSRLYYAVAVYRQPGLQDPQVTRLPVGALPYANISSSFRGEPQGILGVPNPRGGLTGNGYSNGGNGSLEWGGDIAPAGEMVTVPAPGSATDDGTGTQNGNGGNDAVAGNGGSAAAISRPGNGDGGSSASVTPIAEPSALAFDYDDGFETSLWSQPQAYAPRAPVAHAQAIVRPEYTPSDPQQAISAMRDFVQRHDRWRAGVSDTSIFPHSAICQLTMTFPDGDYIGTGFYIGPDRILTCAHNVKEVPANTEASSIVIKPGKNGNNEPFPSFTVQRSNWEVHPNYDGSYDYDLAVISVSTPPPNGFYFEPLEDLTQSIRQKIIVCGYAAQTGDEDKQNLDGDTVRDVSQNLERIQYNMQTEQGNSGSPVFYITGVDDPVQQMSVQIFPVIGVHVSCFPIFDQALNEFVCDQTLNQACRLSQDKINWINSVGGGASSAQAFGRQRAVAPRRTRASAQSYQTSPRSPQNGRNVVSPSVYGSALAFSPFDAGAIDLMRQQFVANVQQGSPQSCIVITNAGLRQLYSSQLQNPDGTNKRLGSTIQDTMGSLQQYGLAGSALEFEYNNASGNPTRGVVRPHTLQQSVEQSLLAQADANQMSAWYVFGLSIMDGYHSVVLGLQFSGLNHPDTRIYWADQIYSGWDDVTGQLDNRITSLTQKWWDPLPQNRKARTRVTVWPLQVALATGSAFTANGLDDIEGAEEEPASVSYALQRSAANIQACVDACTDDFCPANPAATAATAHFTLEEFRCRDGTEVPERFRGNVQRVMENLEVLRAELGGSPITINSGYRTCAYNCTLSGSARQSRHLCGQAADIRVAGVTPQELQAMIERLIAAGRMHNGGLGLYNTFVHYDVRARSERWDRRTATSSGLARAMEHVVGHLPADYEGVNSWWDAVIRFKDWLVRGLSFSAGVPDTTFFPFSAICKIYATDAQANVLGAGSGFYVGANKIITAAHVLSDTGYSPTGIQVVPGLNGTHEPFGGVSMPSSSWQIHSGYNPAHYDPNTDIAVITGAPAAPNGDYFQMEELRMSPMTGIIAGGYAAEGDDVDPRQQNIDIDHIRQLLNGTFTYGAQLRRGSSGGPVYYVFDDMARVVGVNVIANFSNHENQGLRLTDALINWINSI